MQDNSSTINELLNRDPMDLTNKDLDQLVAHFRSERERWQVKEANKKPRKTKAPVQVPDLDLSVLGKKKS